MGEDILYVGWIGPIPEKLLDDYEKWLRDAGVQGEMTRKESREDSWIFEHCFCTERTMQYLIENDDDFWPKAFTAVDATTFVQLPDEYQKYWYWPTD